MASFWEKFKNWFIATGLSNLDGGDNPHPTPKLPGANTHQIYEKLNKGDNEGVKDAILAQDRFEREVAPKKAIVAAGAATVPLWGPHAWKVLTHPVVEAIGTASGLYNLATNQGVKKTINHYRNGEYGKAAWSGFGDLLDASPLFGAFKAVKSGYNAFRAGNNIRSSIKTFVDNAPILKFGRILSRENRAKHAFVTINPFGYDKPVRRGMKWLNSVLSDSPVDPNTFSARIEEFYPNIPSEMASFLNKNREDAWRIYNGLEQKYNTYIKNLDGTYSYNLKEVWKRRPKSEGGLNFRPIDGNQFGADILGANHGGLTGRTTIDLGNDRKVHVIEDVWDLHPFSRKEDRISSKLNKWAALPAGESLILTQSTVDGLGDLKIINPTRSQFVHNNIEGKLQGLHNWVENFRLPWIDKWLSNFEAGSLIGGKPFTMRTIVPTKGEWVWNDGALSMEEFLDFRSKYYRQKPNIQLEFNFNKPK